MSTETNPCFYLQKDRSRVELLKQYRLHIFVCFMFVVTTLSVSLSWHFRNMAQEQLYSSQAIFFNPRTRELTLAGNKHSLTYLPLLKCNLFFDFSFNCLRRSPLRHSQTFQALSKVKI